MLAFNVLTFSDLKKVNINAVDIPNPHASMIINIFFGAMQKSFGFVDAFY